MTRTYATQLDQEHYTATFDHEFLGALRGRQLKPEITGLWSVGTIKPGEDNSGYLLAVVSHYKAPFDVIDVADAERKETLICGCPGFKFHCYDQEIGGKIDDCRHCEQVKKQKRTEVSDQQETLV